jgi:multidrug efflux pump subunit AcrA (membrane-fusion protein)
LPNVRAFASRFTVQMRSTKSRREPRKPEGVVEARPITVGPTTADQTVVASGLAEGERVVVNGQYKLRLGSRVTVNEPPPPAVAKRDRSS